MSSKIADLWLRKMILDNGGTKKVSIILQLKGASPKVRVNKRFSHGRHFLDKSIVPSLADYNELKNSLESSLSELGITNYRSLDSIKSVIVDDATLDQVKAIATFPQVSQILLNKERHI